VSRRTLSPETRAKLSEAKRKWWATRTPEERRCQNGRLGVPHTDDARQKIGEATRRATQRKYKCDGCNLISTKASITRHQAAGTHRGRTAQPLAPDILLDREREGGCRVGADRARLAATDPEFRSLISQAASESYTPERRADQADRMRALSKLHWRCGECGKESNAGGLARHQSATGHTGRTRVPIEQENLT
jgi:hypothetical protein